MSITRRIFVIGSAVLGGGALAGLGIGTGYLSSVDVEGLMPSEGENGSVNLNAWINISPDNLITVFVPYLEMGQGTHTGLLQLAAEELNLEISDNNLRVVHPNQEFAAHTNWAMFLNQRPEEMIGPLSWYTKRFMGSMKLSATGGSTAVVGSWQPMRHAAVVAREMLRQAAAAHLDVPSDELVQMNSAFMTADQSRSVTFGEIAAKAAELDPPAEVNLKAPDDFTVIGKPVARKDVADKVTGSAEFGIDVRLPNMVFATVRQAPVFGGTIRSLDDTAARAMRGVIDIFEHDSAVIVVADNTWRAFRAADALTIDYVKSEMPAKEVISLEAASQTEELAETQLHTTADTVSALAASAKQMEVEYRTPFLAHASLEPMNSTVWWKDDGSVEIWSPTQSAALARQVVETIGDAKSIRVNVTYAGGGFGRRAEKDFVIFAVSVAKRLKGRPVQLTWSRAEDMQHDVYRPAAVAKMTAGLSAAGQLMALDARVSTHSVMASYLGRNTQMPDGFAVDQTTLEGIAHTPYHLLSSKIAAVELATPVPIGFWRSVGHSNNAFFVESLMDECASGLDLDPFDFRLINLNQPRHKAVLETLREKSAWAGRLGGGKGRGVAMHESFRSIVAMVVDVTVDENKQVTLDHVTAVIDCGIAINPKLIEAQVQGGILFGLTAACFGKINVDGGQVEQENFDTYEMLKLATAPSIDVHIVTSAELPGGVGEPGTPPAAPALVNAIFAATTDRVRQLPISEAGYSLDT